jgi:hypothetical protein
MNFLLKGKILFNWPESQYHQIGRYPIKKKKNLNIYLLNKLKLKLL